MENTVTQKQEQLPVEATPPRAKRVVEALEKEIALSSQAKVAKRFGVAAATLSSIRNGKWENISTQMWNQLAAQLRLDEWPVMGTRNFEALYELCSEAQTASRMLVATGAPGMGKTTALRTYASETPNVFYLHARGTMRVGDFLRELLRVLSVERETRVDPMVNEAAEALNRQDRPLLIIDDAGKIIERIIPVLQTLYDKTEFHAGIVLSGTDELKDRMVALKRKNKNGAPEFWSRIGNARQMDFLKKPNKAEVRGICEENGITDKAAQHWLYQHCRDYRALRQDITNAKRVAQKDGQPVTRELLLELSPNSND